MAEVLLEDVAQQDVETDLKRMPENLKKFLLRVQGGKFYLPAAYRIVWFRDECPIEKGWGIQVEIIEGGHEAEFAMAKASILNPDGICVASDVKTETKKDFPAGWVEKAATGAISRALSNCGYGTQFDDTMLGEADAGRLTNAPLERPRTSGRANGAIRQQDPPSAPAPDIKTFQKKFFDHMVASGYTVEAAKKKPVALAVIHRKFPAMSKKGWDDLSPEEWALIANAELPLISELNIEAAPV